MNKSAIDEIFSLLREYQKQASMYEALLKAHLESSEVRVKYWDSKLTDLEKQLEQQKELINSLLAFQTKTEQSKQTIVNLRNWIAWAIATIAGLYALFTKVVK